MCPHCRAFITTDDKVCPYCNERVGPRAVEKRDTGALLGGFIPHARFTTSIILLINAGLFIATVLFSMRGGNANAIMGLDSATLVAFGGKFRPLIFQGEWWRLVTAGFLHGGLLHIAMNSWVLFDLGALVEEMYGTSRLIIIYFVGTVCGFMASTVWSPYVSIGASAGIFGLIGAMIALGLRDKSPMALAIRGMFIRWAIYGMVLGLLPGLRIDNAAHIGGMIGGFIVGYVVGTPTARSKEQVWSLLSYVCLGLTALSFASMFLWFVRRVG
jgi:rhomboid protease GluP